jgi:hypothetical protein
MWVCRWNGEYEEEALVDGTMRTMRMDCSMRVKASMVLLN